ncbi:hypothetical protein M3J09_001447 [Ascochyta lentis]
MSELENAAIWKVIVFNLLILERVITYLA